MSRADIARTRLGAHRNNRLFQFRSFLSAGARLAFGSDWPISSADPLEGMRVAITGEALDATLYGENQNLTAFEVVPTLNPGPFEVRVIWDTGASKTIGGMHEEEAFFGGADHVRLGAGIDWRDDACTRESLTRRWRDDFHHW